MPESVFAALLPKAYPHAFTVTIEVDALAGGVPSDPKVAEGWIRTKLGLDNDDAIRAKVAEVLVERGIEGEPDVDSAVAEVVANRHLNGFKRFHGGPQDGELYIEGRQVKAMIKEAANIRWPKDKWGPSRKGTRGFFAEHIFVVEDLIGLGVNEPTEVVERFVHTWRGDGIQHEEVVRSAVLSFTIYSDFEFTDEQLGLLFLTAESNGLGSSRSQGFGRFVVTGFEKVKTTPAMLRRVKAHRENLVVA